MLQETKTKVHLQVLSMQQHQQAVQTLMVYGVHGAAALAVHNQEQGREHATYQQGILTLKLIPRAAIQVVQVVQVVRVVDHLVFH